MTSGVLTQKPDSPYPVPEAGQERRFSTSQVPKKDGEGTFTKFKNEKGDFGAAYIIKKAEQMEDWNSPQHGTFHQFSILAELAEGNAQTAVGGSGSSGQSQGGNDRDQDIAFAGTFNAAVALTAAGVAADAANAEKVRNWMGLLAPVRGAKLPASPTQPDANEGGTDADIPF